MFRVSRTLSTWWIIRFRVKCSGAPQHGMELPSYALWAKVEHISHTIFQAQRAVVNACCGCMLCMCWHATCTVLCTYLALHDLALPAVQGLGFTPSILPVLYASRITGVYVLFFQILRFVLLLCKSVFASSSSFCYSCPCRHWLCCACQRHDGEQRLNVFFFILHQ